MEEKNLSITEIYESIQGETTSAGLMTSFVRLAGCPLRCQWCDSTYSFAKGREMSIPTIVEQIHQFGWEYVCVTGGEPLAQPSVIFLLQELCARNYAVSLETNGALSTEHVPSDVRVILDIKCPNSGMSDKNYWPNLKRITPRDEIKFVIAHQSDYEWAKEIISRKKLLSKTPHILLSPVHGVLFPSDLVAWMIQDKIPARLNVQLHKIVWSPTARGV